MLKKPRFAGKKSSLAPIYGLKSLNCHAQSIPGKILVQDRGLEKKAVKEQNFPEITIFRAFWSFSLNINDYWWDTFINHIQNPRTLSC